MSKKIVGNIISEEEAARAIESYNESKKLNREALQEMVEWKRAGLPYAPGYVPDQPPSTEEVCQTEQHTGNAKIKAKKIVAHKKETANITANTSNPVSPQPARKTLLILVSIVAIVSLVFNVIQYQNSTTLQTQNKEYSERIDTITGRNANLAYKNSVLERENASYALENGYLRGDLKWYQSNFGCITNPYGNSAYHKLDCHHLGENFYINTIDNLKDQGCWACSDCYK